MIASSVKCGLVALCLLTASTSKGAPPALVKGFHATPLPAAAAQPDSPALHYLGGLHLQAEAELFGGFSSVMPGTQADELTLLNDEGYWMQLRVTIDGTRINAQPTTPLTPLLDPQARPLSGKILGDAEAMAPLPDGVWVAFERQHRIMRFNRLNEPALAILPLPEGALQQRPNGGIEALSAGRDGDLVMLSEAARTRQGHIQGWHYQAMDAHWRSFTLQATDAFKPVSLDTLPDHSGFLLLERWYQPLLGNQARLAYFRLPYHSATSAEAATPPVITQELLRWRDGLPIDNFEGMVLMPHQGRWRLFLISDDNFSPLQRTLLLVFDWNGTL